jgi:hypothetical protein
MAKLSQVYGVGYYEPLLPEFDIEVTPMRTDVFQTRDVDITERITPPTTTLPVPVTLPVPSQPPVVGGSPYNPVTDAWLTDGGGMGGQYADGPVSAYDASASFYTGETGGVVATQTGLPIIGGIAGAIARTGVWTMLLGYARQLLAQYGPTVLKAIVGAAAFATIMKLIGIGAPDDTPVKVGGKGRAKRYSIGTNPRLGTLLKVSKRCDNLLTKTDNRIRKFRSRLHGYRTPRRRSYPGPGYYLSPAERKLLSRG